MNRINALFDDATSLFTPDNLMRFITAVCGVLAVNIIFKIIRRALVSYKGKKPNSLLDVGIINKIFGYIHKAVLVFFILWLFGIDIKTIFSAAGIFGIAITLAAQTSFSNIISGMFVVADHSFSTGDWITIDEITGCVQEITFMSTKVLTSDNQMVRIPNEKVLNSKLINLTCFDKRRFKFELAIEKGRNLEAVKQRLLKIADECTLVLKDPEPSFFIENYSEGVFNLVLAGWSKTDDFFAMKTEVFIKLAAAAEELGLSFPHNGIKVDK